jgi:hypothetical protein
VVAPSLGATGSYVTGSVITVNVPVPAGVVSGSVVIVSMFVGDTGGTTAVDVSSMPTGFAHCELSPVKIDGVSGAHSLVMAWKRATGSDTGTYNFDLSASAYVNAVAARYTDCVATGNPWDAGADSATNTISSNTPPPVNTTTLGPDRLLVYGATCWAGGSWTPPATFAEAADGGDGLVTVAVKTQAVAGASGDVSATCTNSDKTTAWIGGLIGTTSSGVSATDTIGLTDNVARGFGRTVTDAAGITDAILTVQSRGVVVTDAIGLVDNATRTTVQLKAVTDSIAIDDEVVSSTTGPATTLRARIHGLEPQSKLVGREPTSKIAGEEVGSL